MTTADAEGVRPDTRALCQLDWLLQGKETETQENRGLLSLGLQGKSGFPTRFSNLQAYYYPGQSQTQFATPGKLT